MKKILLLGPKPSTKGGVTIWMKIVLDFLEKYEGVDISVKHLPINRSVSLSGLLPIYKRLFYSIKDYTKGLIDLICFLQKEKYDKVHILSSLGIGVIRDWLFVNVACIYKTKPIVHYHCGTLPKVLMSNGLAKKLLVTTLNKSYKSIVLDEESYQAILNAGFNNVVKIGNSFNTMIEELDDSSIKRNDNEILFVGHNVREKGIFELIDALSAIEGITLNIYGPQNENVQNEINEKLKQNFFKGNINFMGLRPSKEIYQAMRKASLFVLPTYTEGFPYVIVEAMASGCPIISTPVGAIEEMLSDGDDLLGYLVEPKNVEYLRRQVLYCLEHRKELEYKAEKAKAKANSEYSTKAIMNKFIELWND